MLNTRELLLSGPTPSLVEQRLDQTPYRNRRVHLQVSMSPELAKFVIRDEGRGFDTSRVPKPGDPDALAMEGGHGLLLMQTFMDEVTFNAAGNEVTMLKRREG